MATLDWSQCPAVESVPERRSGAWVLKDTSLLDIDILSEYFKGYDQTVVGHAASYAREHGTVTFTSVTVRVPFSNFPIA